MFRMANVTPWEHSRNRRVSSPRLILWSIFEYLNNSSGRFSTRIMIFKAAAPYGTGFIGSGQRVTTPFVAGRIMLITGRNSFDPLPIGSKYRTLQAGSPLNVPVHPPKLLSHKETPVENDSRYRSRLKVRIGKALTTEETSLTAAFHQRDVIVQSAKPEQPLNEASWLVMSVRGFTTPTEAREYGERLRSAAHLAGLCTRVGADGRATGDDRTTTHISAAGEDWLRSRGALQPGERTVPDVHGLMVFPDDDNIRVFSAEGRGQATHDPREFIRAIEESMTEGVTLDVEQAIRVLNLAHINASSLAKVVLAISSIEALAVNSEGWTACQRQMIDRAAAWVQAEFGESHASRQVMDSMQRMHQPSLRQQSRRLLEKYELQALWLDWEDVYGRRSRLFHGGALRDNEAVLELAQAAITVCAKIVLSIAKRQGATLPIAAQTHYGVR